MGTPKLVWGGSCVEANLTISFEGAFWEVGLEGNPKTPPVSGGSPILRLSNLTRVGATIFCSPSGSCLIRLFCFRLLSSSVCHHAPR